MSQRIADEIENRRGLVLGLTLAELLLLLLFLLVLALGWQISTLQKEAAVERDRAATLNVKLRGFEATFDLLTPLVEELRKKGGLDTATAENLVTKLGRIEALESENADLRYSKSLLMAEHIALKATSDSKKFREFDEAIVAAAQVDPNDPPAALLRAMDVLKKIGSDTRPEQVRPLSEMVTSGDLQDKIAGLEGEREKYRRQINNLMRSGNGLTYPSCWTTSDGQTEYMFDVTVRDDGLLVRDATPSRANDPQMKMVQSFERGIVVSEAIFHRATVKLFSWSRDEKCRFYAIIRDGTGPASKQRYKDLRTLVEGHFYPLHLALSSPAPRQRAPAGTQEAGVPMGGPYVPVSPGYNLSR